MPVASVVMSVVAFFVFLVILYAISVKMNQSIAHQIKILSEKFGVAYKSRQSFKMEVDPEIYGEYQGKILHVGHFTKGSGKNKTVYSFIKIFLQAHQDKTFSFHRQGLFSKIATTLGGQDIVCGDEEFDKLFVIKGNDEAFIQGFLKTTTKGYLKEIWNHEASGYLQLNADHLFFCSRGSIISENKRQKIEAIISQLYKISEALDRRQMFS